MKSELFGGLASALIPFVGGAYATLLGFRVIGKKPGASLKYDDWHHRWGEKLKFLGPLLMCFGVMLAAIAYNQWPGESPANSASRTWERHFTNDGVCSAEFPGVPTADSATAYGMTMQRVSLTSENGEVYHTLSYSVIPPDTPELTDEERFNSIRTGIPTLGEQSGKHYEFVGEKNIIAGDVSGREFEYVAEKYSVLVRAFILNHRVYRVLVVLPKERKTDDIAQRFLASFRIEKSHE